MFKRLFWLSVGTTLGLATSFWAQRRVRRTVQRFAPDKVAHQVSSTVRTLAYDVRAAAHEGRAAMRQREEALRAEFGPPAR